MIITRSIPITAPTRRPARRAFTLVEILVVLVIIGILASLALPRLTTTRRHSFDLFVNQVADLLLMFAQRDGLGRAPIGLTIVDVSGHSELRLVQLDDEMTTLGDWSPDPLARPVKIPDFVDPGSIQVFADGEYIDIRGWVLPHVPGENRPSLEISLEDADRVYTATVSLPPHAIAPRWQKGRTRAQTSGTIDLDREGRSREDW